MTQLINVECIDFGTLIKADYSYFNSVLSCDGQIFQYLGAVEDTGGRTCCRFLSLTSSDYFTGEPGDVEEWISESWIAEPGDDEIPAGLRVLVPVPGKGV